MAIELIPLDITEEVMDFARVFLHKRVIPPRAFQDAVHIAVAAANGMDFLLTWNCTHIANAQIEARITGLCRDHDFQSPVICTPEELMVG